MKTQRGFVNAGILIAIVLGLIVVGGGAYYIIQPQSPSPNPSENSLDTLPTASTQTTGTTTTNPEPTQQATQPVSIAYTSINFTASPISGSAPLATNFSGSIGVPDNQPGSAVIFFGDGVSDVMFRSGPSLFNEEWSHTYLKPGEYDAVLVLTSVSNVDTDIEVMQDPDYYKNVIVKRIRVSVGSVTSTACENFSSPSQLTSQRGVINLEQSYVRLGNCIYVNGEHDPTPWVALMPVDADSFQVLTYVLTKDKNRVFHIYFTSLTSVGVIEEITGADPATFVVLNDYYAKDKNAVYHYAANADPVKIIAEADVQTFSVRASAEANDWNAEDKNHKYLNGKIVQ